jgi:hypothetical protein
MMTKLYFDVRDLFSAARLGWSLRRIWIAFSGLLIGYVVYGIGAYGGLSISRGIPFAGLWDQYGFFPECSLTPLCIIGSVLGFLILMITSCAICKITYQQLKGDVFFSSGEALKYIGSCWQSVVLGPIAVLGLLIVFLGSGWLIGVVGRYIPYVGEIGFALIFIPVFFASIFAIFIAFAFLVSLIFAPAIVGTTKEDTLEVVIQSFSLLWSQPWRLLLYLGGILITVRIGTFVLACLSFYSLYLINSVSGLAMGEKLSGMMNVGLAYVPDKLIACLFTMEGYPPPDLLKYLPGSGTPSGSVLWAGRLVAVSLLFIVGFILSYALSAFNAGTTLIYLILRKKKDDENLLEREDEEESEPISETPAETESSESKAEGDSASTTEPPKSEEGNEPDSGSA